MPNYEYQELNSDGEVRFCWFRESSPGHIERDALRIAKADLLTALLGLHPAQQRTTANPGVTLDQTLAALSGAVPLETLPLWARKRLTIMLGPLGTEQQRAVAWQHASVLERTARRILTALPSDPEIEIHLPYIDRRGWAGRFDILDRTEFVTWAGRVMPAATLASGGIEEYNALLLAVASANSGPAAELAFADSRRVPAGLIASLLPVDRQDVDLPATGQADVEIRLTLPAKLCRAWNTAPDEANLAHFEAFAPVSVAIQSALRRWIAWLWLSNIENYADTESCYTALSYLVSAPFPGRRRADFTYDTLNTEWMEAAFRHARRPLQALLKEIRPALLAALSPEIADRYHPQHDIAILAFARKDRRSIRAVAAAESAIVNHILKLGCELHGAEDPMQVVRRAPKFMEGLGSRLRRLFREKDLTYLGSLLLLEATHALAAALGMEAALETSVRVTEVKPLQPAHESSLLEPLKC